MVELVVVYCARKCEKKWYACTNHPARQKFKSNRSKLGTSKVILATLAKFMEVADMDILATG